MTDRREFDALFGKVRARANGALTDAEVAAVVNETLGTSFGPPAPMPVSGMDVILYQPRRRPIVVGCRCGKAMRPAYGAAEFVCECGVRVSDVELAASP